MLTIALAILLGDSFLYLIKHLPNIIWSWLLLIISSTFIIVLPAKVKRWLQLPLFVIVGFAWGAIHASWVLAWQLPTDFQSKPLIAIGTIASIPAEKNNQVNFIFAVDELRDNSNVIHQPTKIRLNWYFAPFDLHVGELWELQVRLKPPAGYHNLGSFDYEEWLFEQGIRATGYVQASKSNKLLIKNRPAYFIDRARQAIADGIARSLRDKPSVGLVEALAVGERRSITEEQWDVLRATGTNHLFAIAGLHIGMLSAFIYFIVSFAWRRAGQLSLYLPAQQAAALGALLAAVWYSAQAGFSLPTQRAVIMTAVFLLATLLKRKIPLWQAWSLALLLILFFDPLAILSASFWLSFGTVALIIYGVTGRLKPNRIWWHWGRPQWVIAVGLVPLSLLFFQDFSLVGFIANAIAIPWIGFIVLPLCLIGSCLWLIWPSVSEIIFTLAEKALNIIWIFLNYLAKLDWAQWQVHLSSMWVLLTAIIAVCWFLAPRGMPARWLSLIWIMPLFLWGPEKPAVGVAWFNFLDTGAGVAAIVQTQQHTLVYESVPSSRLSITNTQIQSYLQYAGIRVINDLIINRSKTSDPDQLFSLLAQMPVREVMVNSEDFTNVSGNIKTCQQGQQWQWDGVNFEMIAPNFPLESTSNCELKISSGKQNIILSPELHKTNKTQTGTLRFELAPEKRIVNIRTFHDGYVHFWQRIP